MTSSTVAGGAIAGIASGIAAGASINSLAGAKDNTTSIDSDWDLIDFSHTPLEDAKATNPNYDSNSIEWGQNCQRCVPTYELRRRGYDVHVKPRPTETVHRFLSKDKKIAKRDDRLSHHPFDVWIPPESIHCEEGQISIENIMKEWGDGARAEVMILWEGQHGNGHVFIAEQIKGQTHFIDPQSGKDGVAWYFDLCDSSNIYICRTDNKDISDYIKDCCY